MIQTQTIMVPTMFDKSIAPKVDGEDINSAAQKAKNVLDTAIKIGWRVVHCNPIVYMNVVYIHYVLERGKAYPEQLLKDIVTSDAEDRERLIAEAAAYLRSGR